MTPKKVAADVRTEWGVRWVDQSVSGGYRDWGQADEFMHALAGVAVVTRTVTYGPWEEVPS